MHKAENFHQEFWEIQDVHKVEMGVDTDKPSKKNSRYIYFEVEVDLLNGK